MLGKNSEQPSPSVSLLNTIHSVAVDSFCVNNNTTLTGYLDIIRHFFDKYGQQIVLKTLLKQKKIEIQTKKFNLNF